MSGQGTEVCTGVSLGLPEGWSPPPPHPPLPTSGAGGGGAIWTAAEAEAAAGAAAAAVAAAAAAAAAMAAAAAWTAAAPPPPASPPLTSPDTRQQTWGAFQYLQHRQPREGKRAPWGEVRRGLFSSSPSSNRGAKDPKCKATNGHRHTPAYRCRWLASSSAGRPRAAEPWSDRTFER